MKRIVLITDLDSTLFDWLSIQYHGFSAMLDRVVEVFDFSEDELIVQIKPIH